MSESWDEYAAGWNSNEDVILYSNKAYASLCEIIKLDGLTVLDFGCGTGLLTERISPKASKILGLDSSEKMIMVLDDKRLSNVETLVADLSEETIRSKSSLHTKFDLVVASSVCAFLMDYVETLRLIKRLLKPNGIIVQWDWLRTEGDSGFGLTEKEVESAYINIGMDVLSVKSAFSLENKEGSKQVLMGVAKKRLTNKDKSRG